MGSKFCSECGSALEEGVLFCGECGNKINQGAEEAVNSGVDNQNTAARQDEPPQPRESAPYQPPPSPDRRQQNSFQSFAKGMTEDTYNVHNKRAGYGLGIVVVLMILAVIGYFVIRILK